MKRVLAACLAGFALAGTILLAGCNADTKLTKQEAASIKGNGQMPPEARALMAEKMKEASARMAQQKGGPSGQGAR